MSDDDKKSNANVSFGITFVIKGKNKDEKVQETKVPIWVDDITNARNEGLDLTLPDNTTLGSVKQIENWISGVFGKKPPNHDNLPERLGKVVTELESGEITMNKFHLHFPGKDHKEDRFKYNIRASVNFAQSVDLGDNSFPIGVKAATLGVNNLNAKKDDDKLYRLMTAEKPHKLLPPSKHEEKEKELEPAE